MPQRKIASAPPCGHPTALRLSPDLLAELDAAALAISAEIPHGLAVRRSDAVRVLLREALAARRARGAL